MLFYIFIQNKNDKYGKQSFKEFQSEQHAKAYGAVVERNGARFKAEAVDYNEECTGLKDDPRHQGGWCTCRM